MISERLTSGLVLIVSMQIDIFKNKEPLIVLLSSLKDNVVESCLFINYDKEVFNGDLGFIERIDLEENRVTIRFDQNSKHYEASELDELSLAYAISIHKSQGSEFPIIVMPLATQHFTLLARNLLYTGIHAAEN